MVRLTHTYVERMMALCDLVATWSPDKSRKTSAVIVNTSGHVISLACNDFPDFIKDKPDRHERPAKYKWIEHAERRAINQLAATSSSCSGGVMFMPWYPCADCARAIITARIMAIHCVEPDWDDPKWADDFKVVAEMLSEAKIGIYYVEGRKAPEISG